MVVKKEFQKQYPANSNHEGMQTPCQTKGKKHMEKWTQAQKSAKRMR